MKTTFAVEPTYEDNSLELKKRIKVFQQDDEQMEILISVINEILMKAEQEAQKKLNAQKAEQGKTARSNSMVSNLKNGKIATRARSFVSRTFDFIRNCANTTGERIVKAQKKQ